MIENNLITKRYFDDEGSFIVFLVALPLFAIAITFGCITVITMIVEICKARRDRKEDREETDAKKNE